VQLSCQAVRGWDGLGREQTLTAAIMYRGVLGKTCATPAGWLTAASTLLATRALFLLSHPLSLAEGQARGA
jgi:hypothetical protein